MENKEFMKMVNKNHERAYNEYVRSTKRKNRKEKAKEIIALAIFGILFTLLTIDVVKEDKKLVKECMAKGNSKDYCVIDLER